MAKTAVNTLVTKIKRRSDYDITDSDLENLIIDIINDSLHLMKQLFQDHGLLDEIGNSNSSLSTTASQAYVDISGVTDIDEILRVAERTNDTIIHIIPYPDLIKLQPDPTSDSTSVPDYCARFNNRLYFAPTPSGTLTLYLEYIKLITEVAAGGTLPFENKYDPLLIAMVKSELDKVIYPENTALHALNIRRQDKIEEKLITSAAINITLERQSSSRRDIDTIAPRVPTS